MKENPEEQGMQMSDEHFRFLELMESNPAKVIEGFSRYDLIKPLIWMDRTKENPMTHQQISIKYRIGIQSVKTILKNIKNNS